MIIQSGITYSIDPDVRTWVQRVNLACELLEEVYAGSRLMYAVSFKDEIPDVEIRDRNSFLAKLSKSKSRAFALHNGKRQTMSRTGGGLIENGHVGLSGGFDEPFKEVYGIRISSQFDDWKMLERIWVNVGDVSKAFSSAVLPNQAFIALHRYSYIQLEYALRTDLLAEAKPLMDTLSKYGLVLPKILRGAYGGIRNHRAQPESLGWLNYWSEETCDYLGFPESTRNVDLHKYSYQTPQGAWIVRLTEEPLDVTRADHMRIYADTYHRLPKLGIRVG